MTTSWHTYKVDAQHPSSEVATETSATSIVFRRAGDSHYAHLLLHHAQQLLEFGDKHRGRYDGSVRLVKSYYPSASGYKDELLWAALWLHRATGSRRYLDYAVANADNFGGTGWAFSEFSWDIRYLGLQLDMDVVKISFFDLVVPSAGCVARRASLFGAASFFLLSMQLSTNLQAGGGGRPAQREGLARPKARRQSGL